MALTQRRKVKGLKPVESDATDQSVRAYLHAISFPPEFIHRLVEHRETAACAKPGGTLCGKKVFLAHAEDCGDFPYERLEFQACV